MKNSKSIVIDFLNCMQFINPLAALYLIGIKAVYRDSSCTQVVGGKSLRRDRVTIAKSNLVVSIADTSKCRNLDLTNRLV